MVAGGGADGPVDAVADGGGGSGRVVVTLVIALVGGGGWLEGMGTVTATMLTDGGGTTVAWGGAGENAIRHAA